MPNYFDYMLESAENYNDDEDNCQQLMTEMDLTLCDFDAYVQEGVGMALAAVGLGAVIGAIIGVIIKLVSKKSDKSAATSFKRADKACREAERRGVKKVTLQGWITKDAIKLFHTETYVGSRTFDIVNKIFDKLVAAMNGKSVDELRELAAEGVFANIINEGRADMSTIEGEVNRRLANTGFTYNDIINPSPNLRNRAVTTTTVTIDEIKDRINDVYDIINTWATLGSNFNRLLKKVQKQQSSNPETAKDFANCEVYLKYQIAAIQNVYVILSAHGKSLETALASAQA